MMTVRLQLQDASAGGASRELERSSSVVNEEEEAALSLRGT